MRWSRPRRWRCWVVLLGLALVASACGGDAEVPECRENFDFVASSQILQVQAVTTAEWGPCIDELKVGWGYRQLEAKLGEATFWLDSDRMGDQFAQITLVEACDRTGALVTAEPAPGITRYIRVDEQPGPIQVAVIPIAPRHTGYAMDVVALLDGVELDGRPVAPLAPVSNASPPVQIERALSNGQAVVIIDDREEATQTVELRRPGEEPEVGISVPMALEELEDELGDRRYRAEWYHEFEGGCIVYTIDAAGAGAATVASDLDEVLGFYPLGDLRRGAEEAGLDFGQ